MSKLNKNKTPKKTQLTTLAEPKPIVACLVPCYKQPHPKMQHGFGEMMQQARKEGITVYSQPIVQSSVVHWTRNSLLSELIKSGKPFTHVLFIDDDIVPKPDSLVKMLAHDVDIVAGLCTKRQDPPIPNARVFDPKTGTFLELWEWPEGLIEVDAVGTGMMLISHNALQQVAEVYFQCLYEKEMWGLSDEKVATMSAARLKTFDDDANAWWFRFLAPHSGIGEMGEDISFCWVAKHFAEVKIHVDTTITPEHMGDYGYSIPDFLDYRQAFIEKAKAAGKYINPPSLITPANSHEEPNNGNRQSLQNSVAQQPAQQRKLGDVYRFRSGSSQHAGSNAGIVNPDQERRREDGNSGSPSGGTDRDHSVAMPAAHQAASDVIEVCQ